MKRSGCSEEHKAKGNFESGEVPTITFLLFSGLHTCTHGNTLQQTLNTKIFVTKQAALRPLPLDWHLTKTTLRKTKHDCKSTPCYRLKTL